MIQLYLNCELYLSVITVRIAILGVQLLDHEFKLGSYPTMGSKIYIALFMYVDTKPREWLLLA